MKRDHKIAWALGLFLLACALITTAGCNATAVLDEVRLPLVQAKALSTVHAEELAAQATAWVEGYTITAADAAKYQGYARDARALEVALTKVLDGFKEK